LPGLESNSHIGGRLNSQMRPKGSLWSGLEYNIWDGSCVAPQPADFVKICVAVFPGTNCERETRDVLADLLGVTVELVWHESSDLSGYDAVVLPGGFAYGDHLRAGALARFSPLVRALERFVRSDRPVLGICNGFQVLLEAGLLPGAMLRNADLRFRSVWTHVRIESTDSPFTRACARRQVLRMPIAHGEGNYFAPPALLTKLRRRDQVILRYCDADGMVEARANPNGSVGNIAAICNEARNVLGLMPHPERAAQPELGSTDGQWIFASLLRAGALVSAR
jgi:phosphoribosylformylglycinamidine synthase subunit PurQ / glutaminase